MNTITISKKDWDFLSLQLMEYSMLCEDECSQSKFDKNGFSISQPDKKSSGWKVHKKIEKLLSKYRKSKKD